MFIRVAYEFNNGKCGMVTFFHFGKLLKWRFLMSDFLVKALCKVYVNGDLYEVFEINNKKEN